MGLIDTIGSVMKKFATWAVKNPEKAMAAVHRVDSMYSGQKYEPNNQGDRILVAEQRVNQLQEKTEKLDRKLEEKTGELSRQMQAMAKQIRTLKIWLTATGITLALAIAAIAVFAFWL